MVTISILAVLIVWGLIAKLYVGGYQRTDVMLAWGMSNRRRCPLLRCRRVSHSTGR